MPKDPITIAFYSHKGGVGKTTSIHNFAYILSQQLNYKVLLVDADPQCSLTSLIDKDRPVTDKDQPSDLADDIYKCFSFLDQKSARLPSKKELKKSYIPRVKVRSIYPDNNNLMFLKGSGSFYKLDSTVALAISRTLELYNIVPAILGYFLSELGKEKGAEIILLDLNPGANALNQALLMGSNYFIVPIMPDHFSVQAVKSLSHILPAWSRSLEYLRKTSADSESDDYCMIEPPKLLSILPQRVQIKNGRPVRAYEKWLKDISATIENNLFSELNKVHMVDPHACLSSLNIIKDFHAEGLASQKRGEPIVASTSNNKNVQNIKKQFNRVIYNALSNLNADDKAHFKVDEKLEELGYSSQNYGRRFPLPLPFPKQSVKNWLLSQADDEILKTCAAKEFLSIIADRTLPASVYSSVNPALNYLNALKKFRTNLIAFINQYREMLAKTHRKGNHYVDRLIKKANQDGLVEIEVWLGAFDPSVFSSSMKKEYKDMLKRLHQKIDLYYNQFLAPNVYKNLISIWFDELNTYFFMPKTRANEAPCCLLDAIAYLLKIHLSIKQVDEEEIVDIYSFGVKDPKRTIEIFQNTEINLNQYYLESQETPLIQELTSQFDNAMPVEVFEAGDKYKQEYDKRWEKSSYYPPLRSAEKRTSMLISLFNHKGGVGKTTTTFNLGYMLSHKFQQKVLLVDLDPQCNLSSVIMQEDYITFFDEHDRDEDISEADVDEDPDNSINDSYSLMKYVVNQNCVIDTKLIKLYTTKYKSMYLLPGNMSDYITVEIQLAKAKRDCASDANKNLLGKIAYSFRQIAKEFSIDIVLFDLNPSNCTINEVCLMGSDYFIVPVYPDYFSLQAVMSLSELLPSWHKELSDRYNKSMDGDLPKERIERFKRAPENRDYILPLPPKFLQIIPQRYDIAQREPLKLSKEGEEVLNAIYQQIENLISNLGEFCMLPHSFKWESVRGIPNYSSLGLLAQAFGDPIVEIPYSNLPKKASKETHAKDRIFYRNLFIEIINNIFNTIKADFPEAHNFTSEQTLLFNKKWPVLNPEILDKEFMDSIRRRKKPDAKRKEEQADKSGSIKSSLTKRPKKDITDFFKTKDSKNDSHDNDNSSPRESLGFDLL